VLVISLAGVHPSRQSVRTALAVEDNGMPFHRHAMPVTDVDAPTGATTTRAQGATTPSRRGWAALLCTLAAAGCTSQAATPATDVTPVASPSRAPANAAAAVLLTHTNRLRASSGLSALAAQPQLQAAAAQFAQYMARNDQYGHEADGRAPADRAKAAGYMHCVVAENIAFASSNQGFEAADLAQRLFDGWTHSPPHRRNLLDAELTEVGMATAYSARSNKHYAVQLFGRPRAMAIKFQLANPTDTAVRYELGAQRYTLEPGVVRSHEQCRRVPLVLAGAAEGVNPEAGARYRVVSSGGALQWRRE